MGEGAKVTNKSEAEDMQWEQKKVGFVMGRRAGDSGLPHERDHQRRMESVAAARAKEILTDKARACLTATERNNTTNWDALAGANDGYLTLHVSEGCGWAAPLLK